MNMLKDLLALREEAPSVSNEMYQNINKTRVALEKGLKSWFEQKEQVKVEVLSANSAKYTVEFNYWMRPEMIEDVGKTAEEIVKAAKIPGEVFKIDVDGTGPEYVEAMLGSLRKGMKPIRVEAFFPDLYITVTWKNIVSRGKKI